MANDLEKKIITQLEYYFGNINLPRDKFLKETIEKNDGGWVPLDVLLTFKRLADLSKDKNVIVEAMEKSESKLIEISEDKEKLRRSAGNPLPDVTTEEWTAMLTARTAYAKGFPRDEILDPVMEFMSTYGPVDSITMRHYLDKATNTHIFKGSVNVIFKTEEVCKKFLADSEVKYKDNVLITMSQEAFLAEKKKEFEARKEKKARKGNVEVKVEDKKVDYPSKTIVKLTGTTIAEKLNWNDIKMKVKELSEIEVAHVDFKPGQTVGYMRFRNENEGEVFVSKLGENKFKVNDFEFEAALVTEEEEAKHYAQWNQERQNRKNKPNGRQFGKKRKGNFGRDHPRNKKQQADA